VVVQGCVNEAISVTFIKESLDIGCIVEKLKELLKLSDLNVFIVVFALLKDSH